MKKFKDSQPSRLNKMKKTNVLTKTQTNELILKAQAGCLVSRNKVVEDNIGLIKLVIGRHYNWHPDHEDLFQEGVFGLIKTIEKFDVARGIAFSTYAFGWIRHDLDYYHRCSKDLIRVPIFIQEIRNKIKHNNGKLDEDWLKSRFGNIGDDTIRRVFNNVTSTKSTSEMEDKDDWHPVSLPSKEHLINMDIELMLSRLSTRDSKIVGMGLNGMTLTDIGKEIGLSRERVRQIYQESIDKFKLTIKEDRRVVSNKPRLTINELSASDGVCEAVQEYNTSMSG